MRIIGYIETDFKSKFGVPRQSGLIEGLKGRIIFEPEFRREEAFRGLEDFSHIWVLWKFSESKKDNWSATVAPPRLGGKTKVGVFATRSPFRPNDIGLSCVKLDKIEFELDLGPVLCISGIDMVDKTPVYDIKPYLPYADSKPDATCGFTDKTFGMNIEVDFPKHLLERIPEDKRQAAVEVLEQDPRPAFDLDDGRSYGVLYCGMDIRFKVINGRLCVFDVVEVSDDSEFKKVK